MEASPRVAAGLDSLRDLGVSLSMDDFGTGYSLADPATGSCRCREIKIDRSFIAELPRTRR